MGMIVGTAAVVAAIAGLVLLAAWQIRGEAAPRRGSKRGTDGGSGGGGFGLGLAGVEELHALFSSGKRVQIEQRREQLMLRDDAQAGAPPHFGVDLEAGVAVLRGMPTAPGAPPADATANPNTSAALEPSAAPDTSSAPDSWSTPDTSSTPGGHRPGQAPQARAQSTSR